MAASRELDLTDVPVLPGRFQALRGSQRHLWEAVDDGFKAQTREDENPKLEDGSKEDKEKSCPNERGSSITVFLDMHTLAVADETVSLSDNLHPWTHTYIYSFGPRALSPMLVWGRALR